MTHSKWTNQGLFKMLIKLMETNPEIAKGFTSNKIDLASSWKETNEKLNSLGPPFKDATNWKKVWIAFKGNIKKKLCDNEKKKKQSGFNDNNQCN